MKTIQLINILEGKTYPEAGTALFPYLVDAINEGERICIDMSGVDSIPTLFMNTSFGEVLQIYGITSFKKLISFAHIQRSQAERIKKYLIDYERAYLKEHISK